MKKIVFLLLFSATVNSYSDSFFWGVALEGYPTRKDVYVSEYETGANIDIVQFYLMFLNPLKDKKYPNIKKSLDHISSMNAISCITLEPMYFENKKEKVVNFQDLINGKYDDFLKNLASQIKEFKNPVMIRFAQEMNLSRYHWGDENFDEKSPEIYKKMFRYVVDKFKELKVLNVLWVFCPNSDSVPNLPWNVFQNYYPGDKYVDILGIDGYNWGTCATKEKMGWVSSSRSFDQIFLPSYKELKKISNKKPILIFETASSDKVKDKSSWIKEALTSANNLQLKGVIWFQVDKECKWKIDTENQKNVISNFLNNFENDPKKWLKELLDEKRKIN
ncbi:MAG: hypothetical protein JXA94_04600 [Parachlamydiales bacterium]|nr:hypothetical protein [Parachlamydiales bacterium]